MKELLSTRETVKELIEQTKSRKEQADEEQREQEHFEELRKYVNSLSKAELQDKLYDALVKLEDRRNNYW